MLLWLPPQGSGSGSGNGNDRSSGGSNSSRATRCHIAHAPIYYYYSVLVISVTLVVARLHNYIRLDPRHEQHSSSLYLRPILSTSLSSQHSHQQLQQQHRGWIAIAAIAIPVLSKTVQAAPVVGYGAIMSADKRAHAVAVEHSPYLNDEGEPTNHVPPTPPPPYDTDFYKPSLPIAPTVPTTAPSSARPTITTSTTTSSHATSFTSGTTPYHDPSFPTTVAKGTGPSNPDGDWGGVIITDGEPRRDDSMSSVVNGAVFGLIVLALAAVVLLAMLRRRKKNRVRQGLDFGGVGAYPGNGESSMRQKKTEHHVGLSSFGSASSSVIGSVESSGSGSGLSSTTAMAVVKKPAAAMIVKKQTASTAAVKRPDQMTQFWNP